MIRAKIVKSGKKIEGSQISGHAGYAPSGQDIVCAAASFLSITVVNSLEQQLGVEGSVQSEDGYLSYQLPESLTQEQQQMAQIILQTLVTGLQNLQETYPKYISIQNVRIKGGALK